MYLCIFIIFFVICILWSFLESTLFKVNKIDISSNKLKGNLKIVFISDIHFGNYYTKDRLQNIVIKVNSLKADLIIIGGDYIDNSKRSKFNRKTLNKLFDDLGNLKAKIGVYSVLGNHDYYLGKYTHNLIYEMKKSGINLLINSTIKIKLEDETILLSGIDDLEMGTVNLNRLLYSENNLNLMISHNPDFYEEYKSYYDIGLAGHIHGGQVTFFGLYAPITESRYGQKYVRTINKVKGQKSMVITTKGLGCSKLPIRFFAFPEIIEININR
ncbi:MAG TPA: metallophosphoesterase [Clostridiaceae bacterium]